MSNVQPHVLLMHRSHSPGRRCRFLPTQWAGVPGVLQPEVAVKSGVGAFSMSLGAEEITAAPPGHGWIVALCTGDWAAGDSGDPVQVGPTASGTLSASKPGALALHAASH